jgi:hypothetical protein
VFEESIRKLESRHGLRRPWRFITSRRFPRLAPRIMRASAFVRQLPMRGRRKRRQDRRRDARQSACDALARCRALFAQDPCDSDRQVR